MTNLYERMLPRMVIEHAFQVDTRTSERASCTAPGLQYLVKRRMLQVIFAQSTCLENNMTTYKTLLSNRNVRLCAKVRWAHSQIVGFVVGFVRLKKICLN